MCDTMEVMKRDIHKHSLKIRQHCYYNKAIPIPQAVEGGNMSGISRFERYILLLSAGTLLFTAGWFAARHFMVAPYTIVVEKKEQALTSPVEEAEDMEESQPEGILEGEKININTASIYELDRLPNIGPSKAEAIVAYRTEHGAFERMEDLMEVSGIGEATFEELKEYITIAAENQ